MKKQISHISIHQTSKVFGVLYFVFTALFAIPFGIFVMINQEVGLGLALFLIPLLYMVLGYVVMAIFSLIYNFVASSFGGIEFTLTEMHGKGGSLE